MNKLTTTHETERLKAVEAGRLLAGLRKKEERECAVCGTTVIGTTRRRYCSAACRLKADYARHAEQRKAARRERYRRQQEQR